MFELLSLIVLRALSGAQNGFGYAERYLAMVVSTMVLVITLTIMVLFSHSLPQSTLQLMLTSFLFIFSILSCIMVMQSFLEPLAAFSDIHLWETLIMPCAMGFMLLLGGDLIMIICSVYPGLVLHKGFINLGSGLHFTSIRTEDPTGRFYKIPLLGIAVPRWDRNLRIPLAILSIVVAVIFS